MEFKCKYNCGAAPFEKEYLLDIHEARCSKKNDDTNFVEADASSAPTSKVSIEVGTEGRYLKPTPIAGFQIARGVGEKLDRMLRLLESASQNLICLGPSGTGKTTLAYHIAGKLGWPLAKINCQMLTEASQLYGFREASPETGTRFVPSLFTEAIQREETVVLLDDVAHVHDRTITNGLLPALDFTRAVEIDYAGMYVKVAKKVLIVGTGNQGYQYTGASQLDAALVSRFENRLNIPHPSRQVVVKVLMERTGCDSKAANQLAQLAEQIRDDKENEVEVDMRGLMAAAQDMALGATFFDAIQYTLFGHLPVEEIENMKFVGHTSMDADELGQAHGRTVDYIEW